MKKLMLVALGLAALCGAGLQAHNEGQAACQSGFVQTQPCDHQVIPARSTCVCPKVVCKAHTVVTPEVMCPTCETPKPAACEKPCARHQRSNCSTCHRR